MSGKWMDNFTVNVSSNGVYEVRNRWTPIPNAKPGERHFITYGIPQSERYILFKFFGGYRRCAGSWVRHIGVYPSREMAEENKARLEKPDDTHRT